MWPALALEEGIGVETNEVERIEELDSADVDVGSALDVDGTEEEVVTGIEDVVTTLELEWVLELELLVVEGTEV